MKSPPIASGKSSFDLIAAEKFFAELDLKPGETLLDAACGVGNYAVAAARRLVPEGAVHAVDLWEEGIAALQATLRSRGIDNIHPTVADLSRRIPLADASMDVCLMATVLHDLVVDGTDEGALAEIVRVLHPRGRLAVVEFKKMAGPPGPPPEVRLSRAEVQIRLEPHGLRMIRAIDVGPHLYLALFEKQV